VVGPDQDERLRRTDRYLDNFREGIAKWANNFHLRFRWMDTEKGKFFFPDQIMISNVAEGFQQILLSDFRFVDVVDVNQAVHVRDPIRVVKRHPDAHGL